jgi:phosphoribosylanthranilate isomerase
LTGGPALPPHQGCRIHRALRPNRTRPRRTPPPHRIVQIAGIADQAEADLLVAAGVDWLGFPFRLAVHLPDLSEDAAARIIRSLPPPHAAVIITYLDTADAILDLCRHLGARHVQLHGPIPVAELAAVDRRDPDLFLIKSLVIRSPAPFESPPSASPTSPWDAIEAELHAASPYVDAFLTDTHDPATGATGATGKTHDWALSRRLVELSPRPLLLAGGLTPANVGAAIHTVRPTGVDAHTGVEGPDGRKDPRLVRALVAAARKAWDSFP